MNVIKKFIKELKRVRWPSSKEGNKTFLTILIFVLIASIILFSFAIGLTTLWNGWGVGINGK